MSLEILIITERKAEPPVSQRDKPGTVDNYRIAVKSLAVNGRIQRLVRFVLSLCEMTLQNQYSSYQHCSPNKEDYACRKYWMLSVSQ